MEEWRRQFPAIPGVATPRAPTALPLLDFGPEAERGILKEPPDIVPGGGYTILVPAVDADGNDIAGARAPMVAAPLGTYCGWNLRARGFGQGAMHEFSGSYIPLPETPRSSARQATRRRSILERYPDAERLRQRPSCASPRTATTSSWKARRPMLEAADTEARGCELPARLEDAHATTYA